MSVEKETGSTHRVVDVHGAMHTTIVLFHQREGNPGQYRLVLREDLVPEIEALGLDRLGREAWKLSDASDHSELTIVTRAVEFLAHRDYLPLVKNVVMLALSPGVTQIDLGLMEAE